MCVFSYLIWRKNRKWSFSSENLIEKWMVHPVHPLSISKNMYRQHWVYLITRIELLCYSFAHSGDGDKPLPFENVINIIVKVDLLSSPSPVSPFAKIRCWIEKIHHRAVRTFCNYFVLHGYLSTHIRKFITATDFYVCCSSTDIWQKWPSSESKSGVQIYTVRFFSVGAHICTTTHQNDKISISSFVCFFPASSSSSSS